ncbi:MAG: segregation/condensation protein A [Methermicoccaceae archaeon]
MEDSEIPADPIEMLVELAKKGELDPWHIDIVQTADAFLRKLEDMKQMSLAVPARTLFYSSVLLRMKSEALTQEEEEPFELEEDEEHIVAPEDYPQIHVPVRRKTRRPATLEELITELKKAEVVEKRRSVRKAERDVREKGEEMPDIAHEESFEDVIGTVRGVLSGLLPSRGRLTLSELLASLSDVPAVFIYLSLLFLANERTVWLEQDELFGELYITGRK